MYRGKEITYTDFAGGLVVNRPPTELGLNESPDLDNIVVLGKGNGFRARNGDTTFNAIAMNSGAAISGIGYYRKDNADEFLMAVAGSKLYASSSFSGTMTDITGSLTLTADPDGQRTFVTFNNEVIGFGGPQSGPDAAFIWTGTGNASALGNGSPAAYGGFQANNYIFAYNTAATPSTIYWSILGNAHDWTGIGSGSADVWTSDNDGIMAHAILNTNTVLLFKENSIHQMQIGSQINGAFPIFPLFANIGCAGKNALVVWEGVVYFITPEGRMKITDGTTIYDVTAIPSLPQIDPLWDECNTSRFSLIQGIIDQGEDFAHIIWTVSYGSGQSTNNRVFIWDLRNRCWLQYSAGYKANCLLRTPAGRIYGGHYDGKIYLKNISLKATDDSESGNAVIGYFTSGWIHYTKLETIKQPRKMSLVYDTYPNAGLNRIFYGFDFQGLNKESDINAGFTSGALWDVAKWDVDKWSSGPSLTMKGFRMTGRGNFFQFKIQSPVLASPMKIQTLSISGKEYGQKDL